MLYPAKSDLVCGDVPLESPQEYVNRVMQEAGMVHRTVAERAVALGHKLSAGYVHNIASGDVDNPSVKLVQALAVGLGRPEDEVFLVFRGKAPTEGVRDSFFAMLANEYQHLANGDQKELRVVLKMLQREIQRRLTKA